MAQARRARMNAFASYGLSNSAMMRVPSLTATQPTGDGSGQPSQSPCFRIPPAPSPGRAAAGSTVDKGAIDDLLGVNIACVCNGAIRCTFLRSAPLAARRVREPCIPPAQRLPRALCALGLISTGMDACSSGRRPTRPAAGGGTSCRRPFDEEFKVCLLAHVRYISESDVNEIVQKRQRSG